MDKKEFLSQLQAGLAGLPPEERVAAVQYYTEYFDDAGVDSEADVIAELGDPTELAAAVCQANGLPAPDSEKAPKGVTPIFVGPGRATGGNAAPSPTAGQPASAPNSPPPAPPVFTASPQPAPNPQPPVSRPAGSFLGSLLLLFLGGLAFITLFPAGIGIGIASLICFVVCGILFAKLVVAPALIVLGVALFLAGLCILVFVLSIVVAKKICAPALQQMTGGNPAPQDGGHTYG